MIFFGPQGSGKSTQAKIIAEKFNYPYFSSGELLRGRAESDPALAEKLNKGELVDTSVFGKLIDEFLDSHQDLKGIVFDGFPRNQEQAQLLEQLAESHRWQIVGVLVDISDEVAKERIAKRVELIDGHLAPRSDDKPEILSKRLELYHQNQKDLQEFLSHHKLLVIDGEKTVPEVTGQILRELAALDE